MTHRPPNDGSDARPGEGGDRGTSPSLRTAAYPLAVGVALVAAMLWPLAWPPGKDDFPLSPYPMFARPRPRTATIPHVVVRLSDGRALVASPRHLGTDEIMQAFATAARAVAAGPAAALRLCHEVLPRVVDDPAYPGVVAVEVREDVFDVLDYFTGSRRPLRGRTVARCTPEHQR